MARRNEIRNEALNQAIFTVLTTQYKKDAAEAFKLVKDAGYEYRKDDGRFEVVKVTNGDWRTSKWVRLGKLESRWRRNEKTGEYGYVKYRTLSTNAGRSEVAPDKVEKINFVNLLETPVNTVWTKLNWTSYYDQKSKAVAIYEDKIKSPARMVKVYTEDIEKCQKQIEKLQADMLRYMKYKTEYEQKVIANKKELGLA